MKELQAIAQTILATPEAPPGILATLVSADGSSYRRPGARLLIRADGTRCGSISGGCLEEDVIARAERVRATGTAEAVVYDTTSENDIVWGVGLGCHGIIRVLIEPLPQRPLWEKLAANFHARRMTQLAVVHRALDAAKLGTRLATAAASEVGNSSQDVFWENVPPPTSLVVFGAGDDAMPLARLVRELGWQVTIADPRPAFATTARFPMANVVVAASEHQLLGCVLLGPASFVVVMTHHYIHDVPLLRGLLQQPLAYLGLLGPRKRADKILADLEQQGVSVTPQQRARLHAPVGLDLGTDSPEEVALAITAEMQAVLTGRDARPLRERLRPIHG